MRMGAPAKATIWQFACAGEELTLSTELAGYALLYGPGAGVSCRQCRPYNSREGGSQNEYLVTARPPCEPETRACGGHNPRFTL